jgi:hypothetical protein
VNYNALYEKDSFSVIPFTQCRLGKRDDNKYHGKILVSELGWGRDYKKKEVKIFDVYNPRSEVIQAQVDNAGGWEQYKGQILYFTFQPKRMYPKSLLESAYLFADTEYRMGLFYNSTAKRGFNDNSIVRHAKFESKQDENDFDNNLKNLMGTDNGSNILRVEDDFSESEQGNVRIDKISSDVKADRYAHFETAAANYIRKAFKNIPPQLVDYVQGKLGNTTGEDLIKAQSVYNQLTARDRAKVSRLFSILFDGYKMDINPGRNWEIKQYKLLDDGTVN